MPSYQGYYRDRGISRTVTLDDLIHTYSDATSSNSGGDFSSSVAEEILRKREQRKKLVAAEREKYRDWRQHVPEKLAKLVEDSFPTGSAVIVPHLEPKDYDFVLKFPDPHTMVNFVSGQNYHDVSDYDPLRTGQISCRIRGTKLNFIMLTESEGFEQGRKATRLATELKLEQKADRVSLFRAVRGDSEEDEMCWDYLLGEWE